MHHYVYISFSEDKAYIGSRSCKCLPYDYPYLGSGLNVHRKGILYWKWIYGEYSSRKEAKKAERQLLEFYNAANSSDFFNMSNKPSGCSEQTETAKALISKNNTRYWKGKISPQFAKLQQKAREGGLSHPRADKKVYKFKNRFTDIIEELTRYELCKKYNLDNSSLTKVMKGKLNHTGGWEVCHTLR